MVFAHKWSKICIKRAECLSACPFILHNAEEVVMTRPIWELMNRLPMFEHCQHDELKNTIWFADRVVNIPSSVKL